MENRTKAKVSLFGELSSDRHHRTTAGAFKRTTVRLPRRTIFVIIFEQYQCLYLIESRIVGEFSFGHQ
jgi:hypothetical protein